MTRELNGAECSEPLPPKFTESTIARSSARLCASRRTGARTECQAQCVRQAVKLGFDEIDKGNGIVLKGKKEIDRFIADIATEVRTNTAKNGM